MNAAIEQRGSALILGGYSLSIAAVKANAEHRAANLRGIVDDLRTQGINGVRIIAAELNARGILTPRGGTWHPTSVVGV